MPAKYNNKELFTATEPEPAFQPTPGSLYVNAQVGSTAPELCHLLFTVECHQTAVHWQSV